MDRVSLLSDELLIKILLLLPTKVAVSTSILSKRWEFLWMWLPKLEFVCSSEDKDELPSFLDRNLPLHRAPVIETLGLNFCGLDCKLEAIKVWVLVALSRHVRTLEIKYTTNLRELSNILPSSLYDCKSLVTLTLLGDMRADVPRMVCLASLETLKLVYVKQLNGRSLQRFISICPKLKRLEVHCVGSDTMGMVTVISQSLQSLVLSIPGNCNGEGYVINTPSLEYFKFVDGCSKNPNCLIENMPKLKEADVHIGFFDIKSLIRSIIFVKHLTIFSMVAYGVGDGFVFEQLEHLKLHVWEENSLNLVGWFLKYSPNLRVLNLASDYRPKDDQVNWNQPSTVPESVLSSLQTFSWSDYTGTPEERDLAVYILKNARHLKTTTIKSREHQVSKLEMVKELTLSFRASTMCQLTFD